MNLQRDSIESPFTYMYVINTTYYYYCIKSRSSASHSSASPSSWEEDYAPVLLHDVVDKTELVVLMCCHCNSIVSEYFEATRAEDTVQRQQFFYFNTDKCHGDCIEILISWLIDLADTHPYSVNLADKWRSQVVRVMQIVRIFDDDSEGFWRYLTVIGLVSLVDDSQQQKQLESREEYRQVFRVHGRKMNWLLDADSKVHTLNQFKALTLATRKKNAAGATYLDSHSSALQKITLSILPGVDTFLKEYTLTKVRGGTKRGWQDTEATPVDMRALLARLRLL